MLGAVALGAGPVRVAFRHLLPNALPPVLVSATLGVGNVVMCVVVAQLVMSSLIDQFGLFGAPVYAIDLKRAAGLVLLAGGAALVAIK